ncbi:hypothetical protein ABZZ37_16630 [Streptomyces sp. NPDC006464]|uniref:hypothetical protein n=1 Tax=Streptomyces sp. NPDC006464 TaxID=3154305 RepID=UPI0033AC28C8
MSVWAHTAGRAGLASVLSGTIMLSAAGCSPELRPLAAVYVDQQGNAHALLRSCADDGQVRGPELHGSVIRATEDAVPDEAQDAVSDPPTADEQWIGWNAGGLHKAADFPLFAPPQQWAAETRGPQALQPGYSYELAFGDPDDSYAYSASVTFDAPRLEKVPAGEVLTFRGTMTRKAFEDLAQRSC